MNRVKRVMPFPKILCGLLLLVAFTSVQAVQKLYYRYINDQGVMVIEHSIPPEYVQNGYQVVTVSGQVIKTVEAALTSEEVERQAKAREYASILNDWDAELKRRYSSVHDIEAAKGRKLAELDGSIAILKSNVSNLKKQIADEQALAASSERQGRKVSEAILITLNGLAEELLLTNKLIDDREEQYSKVKTKFDRDIERFAIIRPETK
jgi:uncharacterized protein YqeY